MRPPRRILSTLLLLAMPAFGQTALGSETASPDDREISTGLRKLSGIEPTQKIAYARIFLSGKFVPPSAPPDAAALTLEKTPPVLIAQCTKDAKGKLRFELMTNLGGVTDAAYYPPWKSTGPDDLFAPATEKIVMTFDFFGYIKVKPVKRQWEKSLHVTDEFRYNPPSSGSRNMEEITFYLQYLKALPTLRLTNGSQAAQFDTAPWLAAVHAEPLCAASGV
jgi:hypothetical protein